MTDMSGETPYQAGYRDGVKDTLDTHKPLGDLAREFNHWCVVKGHHTNTTPKTFGDHCELMHSEISEAYDEFRIAGEAHGTEPYFEAKRDLSEATSDHYIDGESTFVFLFERGARVSLTDYYKIVLDYPDLLQYLKPRGIPFELADLLIRALENFIHYGWLDPDESVRIVHEHNKTREFKHGKKA